MTGRVEPLVIQRGRFDSAFFRSKFRSPNAPDHFVRRPRLVDLLDDLSAYPVTALVAPAGSGKTALVGDWVHRCGLASAWLTLDESDRDPAQLCAALISAVATLAPSVADRAMAVVSGPSGPMGALRVLTEDLEVAEGDEAVLVVDDLHRIDDSPDSQAVLAAFVENRPDALHLMLLARRRPALPIDRLRATGRLADLTFDVLRFSEEEALEMLAGLCPDTAPRDLLAVAEWSGGWAAALQLAALAVRSQRAGQLEVHGGRHTFPAGSERLVDSYLWHEVLRAERVELVELLLSTAVVDRMNYGLADALTGRSDAGDLLLEAEERGLFVTSFDPAGWYEVHSLVREMLLAELERRSPEQLREQHARAARWFESMDDGMAALGHWLEAGQPAEALRLLTATSLSLFDGGRVAAIDRIIGRIPPQVAGADAASMVRFAWCRLLVDRTGFLDALAAAEAAVTRQGAHEERGRLAILRSVSAWLAGDWQVCVDLALDGLVELGDAAMADPIGRFGWSLVVRGMALGERWRDVGGIVERGRTAFTHDSDGRLAYEAARAVGLALSGQPIDCLQVAAGVRHVAEVAEKGTLRVELDIAEAVAARELGDRDRAEPALEALAARSAYPSSYVRVLAMLELVELRLGDGDVVAAESLFHQVEELSRRELDGADGRGWLARVGVLLSLAQGDVAGAEHWSRRTDDSFWRPICEARVHLAAGRLPDAVETVHRAEPRCVRHRVVRELLLGRALLDADRDKAAKSVANAVDLAAEHGMLQTVAADGEAVLELIELAAWRVPGAWMDRVRRALPSDLGRGPGPSGLVEALTDRERDVLHLLPSRLTHREIASELFISQNTLKFHLRVIYRKLGVNSRAGAVECARQLRPRA
jgi:LuxR family transcriptional regulator, maltose regulon positive regulatory protein